MDNHVKNIKYGNFVSISSLAAKCAAQKKQTFAVYIIWSLISQNKIADFLMILAWASSFNGYIDNVFAIANDY